MTNETTPKIAGGLPELPVHCKTWPSGQKLYTADQMRAIRQQADDAGVKDSLTTDRVAPASEGELSGAHARIIAALASIVTLRSPDSLCDLDDMIPREPVMALVQRIFDAADELAKLHRVADARDGKLRELVKAKVHEWRTDAVEIRYSEHAHGALIAEEYEAHADELDAALAATRAKEGE